MKAAILRTCLTAVGLILILFLTFAVLQIPVWKSATLVFQGSMSDANAWARTLVKTTPLLLTGLGVLIAWRAGMYNIGGEGQFVVGAIFGAMVFKLAPNLPPALLSLSILVSTMIGGALYAGIAGWLQVKRGVQVVVSTILLNFIALELLKWVVSGPLQEKKRQLPLTDMLPNAARLMRFSSANDLHSGVFVAFACVILVAIYLYRTAGGFKLRLVGSNPRASRAARLAPEQTQLKAMLISGTLCGLAGGVEYTGISYQLGTDLAQNWGFLAIPVALIGMLNPYGVAAAALYFGALFAGSKNLEAFTKAGSTIVLVVQSVAVLGFVGLNSWLETRASKKEAPL